MTERECAIKLLKTMRPDLFEMYSEGVRESYVQEVVDILREYTVAPDENKEGGKGGNTS